MADLRLENIETQPEAEAFLMSLVKGARVPSLLFTGPEGCGKKTHALALVKSIFCAAGPSCAGCPNCRQVDAKAHPDLHWVERGFFWPEEDEDKKKKSKSREVTSKIISSLTERLSLSPLNAPLKVAVVPDAHLLNVTAQDKFLKTLEEPPPRVMIILISPRPGSLLPTIQSRCRQVRFKPLDAVSAEGVLKARGFNPGDARNAARASAGNLLRALRWADEDWRGFIEKALKDFDRAFTGTDRDWMEVAGEYETLDPGFWDDEDISAGLRKARVVEEALLAVLGLWDSRSRGDAPLPEGLKTLSPHLVRECLRRHLDLLPTHLAPRMVLEHLFIETREAFRTGRYEPAPWLESALKP